MITGNAALGQVAIGQADPLNRALTAGLLTNTSVFYSPTVVFDQALTQAATASNTQTFYTPTVAQIFYLRPSLVSNTSYFFERAGLWSERSKQSETWVERTKQDETWTRAA